MKTKKFSKKMGLNKKTIANLGNEEMDVIKGGDIFTTTLPIVSVCIMKTCELTRCSPCP